jgi:nucleoside-diphosphate-sugar epimerase
VVSSGADAEAAKVLETVLAAGKARVQTYAAQGIVGPKLGFVYTSGTWVHGSSILPVTDLDVVGSNTLSAAQSPALVAWRPAMEQSVLKARDILYVMVIRTALVYGRSSTIWSSFFAQVLLAKQVDSEIAQVPLIPSQPSLIHVDDVASGLAAAVDKLPLFSGTGMFEFSLIATLMV